MASVEQASAEESQGTMAVTVSMNSLFWARKERAAPFRCERDSAHRLGGDPVCSHNKFHAKCHVSILDITLYALASTHWRMKPHSIRGSDHTNMTTPMYDIFNSSIKYTRLSVRRGPQNISASRAVRATRPPPTAPLVTPPELP
jgi:hypothetical protein